MVISCVWLWTVLLRPNSGFAGTHTKHYYGWPSLPFYVRQVCLVSFRIEFIRVGSALHRYATLFIYCFYWMSKQFWFAYKARIPNVCPGRSINALVLTFLSRAAFSHCLKARLSETCWYVTDSSRSFCFFVLFACYQWPVFSENQGVIVPSCRKFSVQSIRCHLRAVAKLTQPGVLETDNVALTKRDNVRSL